MTEPRDDMDLKRALDALPRVIEPPTDLWPAVRARIGGTVGQRDGGTGHSITPGLSLAGPAVPLSRRPSLRMAALLTLLGLSSGALYLAQHNAARWYVERGDHSEHGLWSGSVFSTGNQDAAIRVGNIGRILARPNTDIRLLKASYTEQRMAMTRGEIHVEVSAPPRLFSVETPGGTAVDLGCAYALTVDSAGNTNIVVTAGWVEFQGSRGRSLIPQGMHASAPAGREIGLPVRDGASDSLRQAARAFDNAVTDTTVAGVLRAARREDAVTLWHMIERTQTVQRMRVITALVHLVPFPSDVPIGGIETANAQAMELYWTRLPGTLPIVPSWEQALWKLWLRIKR